MEVESEKNDSSQRIQEIVDGISVNIVELLRSFCDVSTENIIEGSRTRSQSKQANTVKKCYAVLKKLRRALLKYKMPMQVKEKRTSNSKGYRSYKQAVLNNPSWEDAYLERFRKSWILVD